MTSCIVCLLISSTLIIFWYKARKLIGFSFDLDVGLVGKIFTGTLVPNSLISLCNVGELSFETGFFTFLLNSLPVGSPTRFLDGLENNKESLNNVGDISIKSLVF